MEGSVQKVQSYKKTSSFLCLKSQSYRLLTHFESGQVLLPHFCAYINTCKFATADKAICGLLLSLERLVINQYEHNPAISFHKSYPITCQFACHCMLPMANCNS